MIVQRGVAVALLRPDLQLWPEDKPLDVTIEVRLGVDSSAEGLLG